MFGNWINVHDLARLKEKIQRREWRQALKKIGSAPMDKTRSAWSHTQDPPIHAWDMPALRRHWNLLVSGDAGIDHVNYIVRRYLSGRRALRAFSPGCGSGGNEMRWAETGLFERIDARDLSAPRIASAVAAAEKKNLAGIVRFAVDDWSSMDGAEAYDLVITEGALHHFYPMRAALEKILVLLKPGGLLVVNDFVGPSRFQWPKRQLQAANAMLALIPAAYRRRWPDGKLKKRITAPGRLRMLLADPSEAAESASILPLLKEMFVALDVKNQGGALIPLVFHEIAHHYIGDDQKAEHILRLCLALEDLLTQGGEISSDYILGVFQKPAS